MLVAVHVVERSRIDDSSSDAAGIELNFGQGVLRESKSRECRLLSGHAIVPGSNEELFKAFWPLSWFC
jgi:hypothetical protein